MKSSTIMGNLFSWMGLNKENYEREPLSEYPSLVSVSIALLDNKIVNYQITANGTYWSDYTDITWDKEISHTKFSQVLVKHKTFTVNNTKENNHAFDVLAREWMNNWKVHEDYTGSPSFVEVKKYNVMNR